MSYENAWITLEEVEKYQLDQDYEQSKGHYGLFTNLEITKFDRDYKNTKDWTVNRENYNYLRWGGRGSRGLGIGTPGNHYYIFKWSGGYLFLREIKLKKVQENDNENKIAYYDIFLVNEFIPDVFHEVKIDIIKELRQALVCYGEAGMPSRWKYILDFKF